MIPDSFSKNSHQQHKLFQARKLEQPIAFCAVYLIKQKIVLDEK